MPNLLLLGLVFAVGALTAYQIAVNGLLANWLGHPLRAALVSFCVGTTVLSTVVLTLVSRGMGWPTATQIASVPWYGWLGGICGAIFVLSSMVLAPRVGFAAFGAAVIAGQLLMSILLDHYGWLGLPVHPFHWGRLLGVLVLLLGVWLIQRP